MYYLFNKHLLLISASPPLGPLKQEQPHNTPIPLLWSKDKPWLIILYVHISVRYPGQMSKIVI